MNINLISIFLTGLTVGGLTCLAVQGGLLASVIANLQKESPSKRSLNLWATVAFLVGKFFIHVIFGTVLGGFGQTLNLHGTVQIGMQLVAGVYMIVVALNLLEVHPIFRYAILQPPKFLARLVHNQSKSHSLFAPVILGLMTIFIPCGTTLAMEALAISSANAFWGAAIMGTFVLGTIPLFMGIGFLTSLLGEAMKVNFYKIAAVLVLYLGLSAINGSLVAMGSPISAQSVVEGYTSIFRVDSPTVDTANLSTNPIIEINSNGYSPNIIRVPFGKEINLTLKSVDAYSCASAFRIPSLGINKNLQPNETTTVKFTPTEKGRISFNCSMGMYRGLIEVL